MELAAFAARHVPALEREEARHSLLLGLLGSAQEKPDHGFLLWCLGEPGACAIKTPGRGIILGELSEGQCRELARITAALDYPSVIGADAAPDWFVAEAERLGLRFRLSMAQRIHALSRPPRRPDPPGAARPIDPERDVPLLLDYTLGFIRDAALDDPLPTLEEMERSAQRRRHWFWEVDGAPVAMAGIARRSRNTASIAPVYTVPEKRGRGFGGAVTAAVVDAIFAEGRRTACLYTDLGNPASNRCYAKLGFEPVCDSRVFHRVTPDELGRLRPTVPSAARPCAPAHPRARRAGRRAARASPSSRPCRAR